ncbi:hypothetical protein EC973_002515 [Apophysomyces ossiformis]|uniref:P-loop containing nucleoside triphosphate hydrolase protein n=1 Tax=Apophysomyces ossiformis TaxID=679940 RepID=A0A8H7EV27_9FUNG|nr:hypothetical protein EC973_002515 [Apophysomyces ossiformis]
MMIALPINHYSFKVMGVLQTKLLAARDKRVALTNEALQGIRQLKLFAWETHWKTKILDARRMELRHLRRIYVCKILLNVFWHGVPVLVALVSFWGYIYLQGQELSAAVAFTSISVFSTLRSPIYVIPELITDLLQCFHSLRRLESYLKEQQYVSASPKDVAKETKIGFENATIGWRLGPPSSSAPHTDVEDRFWLKDINAQFAIGEMNLICGATGSGKTLLMLALLGEAMLVKGKAFCPRSIAEEDASHQLVQPNDVSSDERISDHGVAYVSQTAWLQHTTIRENILFGLPYDEKRYEETVYACALEEDFLYLPEGDRTQVGERGITLSGGQKARVTLARAVYSRAKNVLMDDVLSAVDAHTARHLYEKCLVGPLMKDRTRILITHQVGLCLKGSSYLVHIQGGRVNFCGTPSDLYQLHPLPFIIEEFHDSRLDDKPDRKDSLVDAEKHIQPARSGVSQGNSDQKKGCIIACRGLEVLVSWWLKKWTGKYKNLSTSPVRGVSSTSEDEGILDATPSNSFHRIMLLLHTIGGTTDVPIFLGVYVLLNLMTILAKAIRISVLYYNTVHASKVIHQRLLNSIFRAPLRWFDTVPVGAMLNRFTNDLATIDLRCPYAIMGICITTSVIVSSLLVVAVVMPKFLLPIVFVALWALMMGIKSNYVSRRIQRLYAVTSSPILTHCSETLAGAVTIRAFGVTRQFMQTMLTYVDQNARPAYYHSASIRWSAVRFSCASAASNFLTVLALLTNTHRLDAATAGFCITFGFEFYEQLYLFITRHAVLDRSFNCVERIADLLAIDQEGSPITDVRPPVEWPSKGEIHVEELAVRYGTEHDLVLKGLTFTVRAGEKVGIVGRTGSGKSTLALSFFRLVEAAKGRIIIDDVDIAQIGTEDLRSNLTIIPQDPLLFTGTLRSNIDPWNHFDDESILTALRRVHLLPSAKDKLHTDQEKDANPNIFNDLNTPIDERGNNFSQGQRQLLCLARALLTRLRVVIMDEATASIDFETDRAIQQTISSEFAACTVLCIAHRLHTIIGYDRIMVLDQGEIKEFSSPLDLINDSNSLFHNMCRSSGDFENLVTLAKARTLLMNVD